MYNFLKIKLCVKYNCIFIYPKFKTKQINKKEKEKVWLQT